MSHGGDIYRNKVDLDFSVSLNPGPVPEAVRKALLQGLSESGAYPDPRQESLRAALSRADRVDEDCIWAGNGASEILLAVVRAIAPRKALLPVPGFSGYRHVLQSLEHCEIREIPLKEEDGFAVTERILGDLDGDADLLFLTDPWNPSGKNLDNGLLDRILEKAALRQISVLLDESFYRLSVKAFRTEDMTGQRIRRYPNLIVVRSFTKLFALPGIRMGYAVSCRDKIDRIRHQLPEWNLSGVAARAMEAGAGLLAAEETVCDMGRIMEERAFLARELEKRGCRVIPGDTLFLLFRADPGLYDALLARGILIRDCRDFPGLSEGWFRVAVRDPASNRKLLAAMDRS